jgi:hypothetical protein
VNLDALADEVAEPGLAYAGPGIQRNPHPLLQPHAAVGHLDEEQHVGRDRVDAV